MTEKQKLELIKEKYPNYKDVFSQSELDGLLIELDDPEKLTLFRERGVTEILGGAALGGLGAGAAKGAQLIKEKGPKIAKATAEYAKAKLARPAKTDTVLTTTQKAKKIAKKTGKYAVLGAGAAWIMNTFGGDDEAEQEAISNQQTQQSLQTLGDVLTTAQQAGVDPNLVLEMPMVQKMIKNPGLDVNAAFNNSGVLGAGVYVGGEKPQVRRRKLTTYEEEGTIPLSDWKRQFPIGNPTELAKWKKTLVDAGVVGADAGVKDLQTQWETWGQLSLESNRAGQKLTPYQLLDIQRGLWGGGGGGPSYQVQLMKEENSKALFKQGIEALTGRIVDDAQAEEFAKLVKKKQLKTPTKTETKTVGGKRVSVTTPGFGEAEAAALIKERAQEDPMFAEFQTANVFGSALEKALGVRG